MEIKTWERNAQKREGNGRGGKEKETKGKKRKRTKGKKKTNDEVWEGDG